MSFLSWGWGGDIEKAGAQAVLRRAGEDSCFIFPELHFLLSCHPPPLPDGDIAAVMFLVLQ